MSSPHSSTVRSSYFWNFSGELLIRLEKQFFRRRKMYVVRCADVIVRLLGSDDDDLDESPTTATGTSSPTLLSRNIRYSKRVQTRRIRGTYIEFFPKSRLGKRKQKCITGRFRITLHSVYIQWVYSGGTVYFIFSLPEGINTKPTHTQHSCFTS